MKQGPVLDLRPSALPKVADISLEALLELGADRRSVMPDDEAALAEGADTPLSDPAPAVQRGGSGREALCQICYGRAYERVEEIYADD